MLIALKKIMAFAKIKLKSKNGSIKEAPVGFSWTVFFASWLVPLSRGDWKWAIIIFIPIFFTFGLSSILFAFIYNRTYIEGLLKQGYKIKSYSGDRKLIEDSAQINLSNSSVERSSDEPSKSKLISNKITKAKSKTKDLTDELEDLQELYEEGTLSEEQFIKAKNKFLK